MAAITQPAIEDNMISSSYSSSSGDSSALVNSEGLEDPFVDKPAIKTSRQVPDTSITGLPLPHFIHPIAISGLSDETPADQLPANWYHFDTGCRHGNDVIPYRDYPYERALIAHTKIPANDEATRVKAHKELILYEKLFLIYRKHVARTLDKSKWNHGNIKEHPAYEPDWPYALLGHPTDSEIGPGNHAASSDCGICKAYAR